MNVVFVDDDLEARIRVEDAINQNNRVDNPVRLSLTAIDSPER